MTKLDDINRYKKFHHCECLDFDRENCPICKKKCHHDTELSPKNLTSKDPPPNYASKTKEYKERPMEIIC